MKEIRKAKLADGREVEYVVDPNKVMEGGMKRVYFTPDKSHVLCFFKDQQDATRYNRLQAVVSRYNPTIQSDGEYWKKYFCWPTAIVVAPSLGIMCPTYPQTYFFKEGPWAGSEKEGSWFCGKTGGGKLFRDMMPESERGTWINYFRLCITMSQSVWRLHAAGLAHSDLSPRNILIDPSIGQSIMIDIDSLVVPGIFPPDVMGTPGYIAPEVLATSHLSIKDPRRKHACAATDQHALAVLVYQYLLCRHPLKGPRVNSDVSAEKDEFLSMGEKALFIEHPTDKSNRPSDKELGVTYNVLGPHLVELFNQAFIEGLHNPNRRPIAAQWVDALLKTWNLLYPCPNPSCTHKWFVVYKDGAQKCPFCHTTISGRIYKFLFRKEVRPGNWMRDGELVIYNGSPLFKWHVFDNVKPIDSSKNTDREMQADCQFYKGKWILINRKLPCLVSEGGSRVPVNTAIELKEGTRFRLSTEPHGRIVEVSIIQ
ncbi:MAG: serine/threonine protein kinase [bacterium]